MPIVQQTAYFLLNPLAYLQPSPLPVATQGTPYSVNLQPSGGVPPYTSFFLSGTLAAGLTLNANSTVTGTPSSVENDIFIARLTDSTLPIPQVITKQYSLSVGNAIVVNSPLPAASQGIAYASNFTVTGGTPPIAWHE